MKSTIVTIHFNFGALIHTEVPSVFPLVIFILSIQMPA